MGSVWLSYIAQRDDEILTGLRPPSRLSYSPQILQGADIIAETLGIRVVMHDMFDGKQPDFIPPKSDEDRKAMREWMDAEGNPANYPEQTYKVADALRAEGFTKIGALGYCWGTCLGRRVEGFPT